MGPQFKSLIVGPTAILMVYDTLNFRHTTATFEKGQTLPDLDQKMGIFRTICSLKINCTK